MNNFFETPAAVTALVHEAQDWCGTPFAPHASCKHAGADCVGLVAGIYFNVGFLKKYEPGKYSMDEGQHLKDSKVLAWFKGRTDFQQVALGVENLGALVLPGDAICFHLGRVEHHVGLMLLDEQFIHSLPSRFAMVSNLRESFYGSRITAIFRPLTASVPPS